MHLIDLIAELEAEKIRSGNVKLHGAAVLVEGAAKPLVDYYSGADLPTRRNLSIAEVPKPRAVSTIDVRGMSEDQIAELRAQYPDAVFLHQLDESEQALEDESKNAPAGAPVVKVPEDAHMRELEAKAAAEAKAQLGQVMETAAAKLPGATGTTTMGTLNTSADIGTGPVPCDRWDGKGHACTLALGHDGDHNFVEEPESLQE